MKRDGSKKAWSVTVDCPKKPFKDDLIRFMAMQAGVTKKQFYQALNKKIFKDITPDVDDEIYDA